MPPRKSAFKLEGELQGDQAREKTFDAARVTTEES
jgi:hypothetical protein